MKFFSAAFLLSICFSAVSFAQGIRGVVQSSTGKGIAFANIRVLNSLRNTEAGKDGNFTINVPVGSYVVSVSATGYLEQMQSIHAGAKNEPVKIILRENAAVLDEVIVTGTKTCIAKNYVPFNVSIVGSEKIGNSSESSLLPVLEQQVPGLFVTQRGVTGFGVGAGSAGSITMRGLGGNPNSQVLVLINGSPQFMGIFGHPLPDAYVASDVEKVEVIHGAGSVLYGTNAMAGVINIITRSQEQDGYAVNGRILYGSFNTQKYMVNAGYKRKGLGIMASFNNDKTDGHRPAADFNISNGFLKLNYTFSPHFNISAETNIAVYKATDPGPVSGQKGTSINIFRGSSYLHAFSNYKHSSGSIRFFYNYGRHKISDGFRSRDANYGLSVFHSFKYIKNNTTSIGFDYKNYGGRAENIFAGGGQGVLFGSHTISEWAPYIFSQQSVAKKLILSVGFRTEKNSVYGSIPVPSGGVSYLATKSTTLKASVSKGFRSPTILELYLFPPANPNLQPEKMTNYEVSIHQQLADKKISLECTFFKVKGGNLIQTIFQNGGPKNVNAGAFNNTGIEFSSSYVISNRLNVGVNYGYTDLKRPVLAVPKHQLLVNGNYTTRNLLFNISLQEIASLYTQTGATPLQNSYFLINARAGCRASSFFDVFVKGENLSNRQYQINNGYPMPGITLLAGLNIHLAKLQ
jgi:outer membrane cobalamin receptor